MWKLLLLLLLFKNVIIKNYLKFKTMIAANASQRGVGIGTHNENADIYLFSAHTSRAPHMKSDTVYSFSFNFVNA